MSAGFDPYYTWLAIPPEEQPPHLYRLLGVKPLEENLDVIENAADQRMLHLRTYGSGKQAEHSQKLLNEVSAAKVMLLDPAKKSAYDAELRAKLNAAKQAEVKKIREERPLAMAKPLPTATPLAAKPAAPSPAAQVTAPQPSAKPRAANNLVPLIAIGVVALVLLGVGGLAAMMFLGQQEPAVAVNTNPGGVLPAATPETDEPATTTPAPPVVPPVVPPPSTGDKPPVGPPTTTVEEPAIEETDPQPPIDDEPVAEEPADNETPAIVEVEPADDTPQKLAVPEKAEREAKRKEILAIFPTAQAKTFDEKGELAAQLISTAGETVDDPAAVFAMLNLAREQAAEAGQIKLAFEATDMLGATFDFDASAVRIASLQQASRAASPAAKRDIVVAGMEVIDELSSADKFDEADALSDRMLAVARPLRDAQLIKDIAEQKRKIDDGAASYKKAQTAFATLKTSIDDADANLAVGKYLAFVKQDWDAALAHLAKGSDAPLAAAAKAELAVPESPADEEKLADAWWAAADAQKDAASKDVCRAQAVYWYREVADDLSGLAKVKIEKRIDEARDLVAAAPAAQRAPRRKPKGPLPAEITVMSRSPQPITESQGMPKEFVGFSHFPWNDGVAPHGMLEFTVERPGLVYMSASFPETKYEGNNSGGWYDGRATRDALVQSGWQELGKCPWDDTRLLYVRQFEKGGPFRIQTNKYGAPDVYLPPDPLARSASAVSAEPDLGVFSRDPAEFNPAAAGGVVYLDDLTEVDAKVTQGPLGKHGDPGFEGGREKFFRDERPEHSLTMCPPDRAASYVVYDLGGKYKSFSATAGLWEEPNPRRGHADSPLTYKVVGDGNVLWESKPMQNHGVGEDCSVDITGVKTLRLEVHSSSNSSWAWAVWISPQVVPNKSATTSTRSTPRVKPQIPKNAVSFRGHYYWVSVDQFPHAGALAACEKAGGYLARIESQDEQDFAVTLLQDKARGYSRTLWIDGSDAAVDGVWKFSNGRGMPFLNWNKGEPNNQNGTEDYIGMFSYESPGFWNDEYPDSQAMYVCEWDDPRTFAADADDGGSKTRPPKAKKPNPKAFYHCVIGGYMEYHESKPLPLANLQVPKNNLWNDDYAGKLGSVVRSSLGYRGSARFFAPQDGDYDVQATNMGVVIDGVKLPGWRDGWTERVQLRKGLHTIVLDSHTHGQPFLQNASVKIIEATSGDELPLVNLWADVQIALATPVNGVRVTEISGWQPDEEKIVPIKLK